MEAVYGYVIGDEGHLQIAGYFDEPKDEPEARLLIESVTARGRG